MTIQANTGHHADGSSIQKHSAGGFYPFVLGKQEGHPQPWFVLSPEGATARFTACSGAIKYASAAVACR